MATAVKNVEILSTLEGDPHVLFFPWQLDVHDVAASMAKSIHKNGLLYEVLTDEQWASYPGNTTIDNNGQAQIAARYQPPQYVEVNGNMTSVELYVAKANNDKLQLWIDAGEALKRAVIKSLGRVVRQVVQQGKTRFQQLSVFEILARVRARYGKMQKDTNSDLKGRMLKILMTAEGIDTHISDLQDLFDISDTAGFPVDEYRKVEIFRETVCAHPLILKALETFDFDFPDAKGITFIQISEYVTLHMPNLKYAQMASTRAAANLVAASAYSSLEAESKKLHAEIDQLKRKRPPDPTKNKIKPENRTDLEMTLVPQNKRLRH